MRTDFGQDLKDLQDDALTEYGTTGYWACIISLDATDLP